jgi:hypothetical protein
LRDLPAAVGEGSLNVFQIAIGQHFAGQRDPHGQYAALDRLAGGFVAQMTRPMRHEVSS